MTAAERIAHHLTNAKMEITRALYFGSGIMDKQNELDLRNISDRISQILHDQEAIIITETVTSDRRMPWQ